MLTGLKQELCSTPCYYSRNSSNIGFDLANNNNFVASGLSEDNFFIVVNADTYFEDTQLAPLLRWLTHNKSISCAALLLLNPSGSIQYSAKNNPTLLSLALCGCGFCLSSQSCQNMIDDIKYDS